MYFGCRPLGRIEVNSHLDAVAAWRAFSPVAVFQKRVVGLSIAPIAFPAPGYTQHAQQAGAEQPGSCRNSNDLGCRGQVGVKGGIKALEFTANSHGYPHNTVVVAIHRGQHPHRVAVQLSRGSEGWSVVQAVDHAGSVCTITQVTIV